MNLPKIYYEENLTGSGFYQFSIRGVFKNLINIYDRGF